MISIGRGLRGRVGGLVGVFVLSAALVQTGLATAAFGAANCGDGILEGGEECDPGGPKFNESPQGQYCSTDAQCTDGGTCVNGHCRCTTNSQCDTNVCATGPDGFGHCTCTTGSECFYAGSGGCCKFNCQAVGSGNACDDGNACSIGEQCNNVGQCTCSGGCDPTAAVGSVCRSSTGDCDLAEICLEGIGCPADAKAPAGTACPDDGILCTADQCNGSSALCQHPAGNAGTVCRASAGECDPAETCTGSSATCPAPQSPTGTPCTDDGNVCTNDLCDSNSTCTHPNNTAPCSDGLFCNGSDTCSGGSCSGHSGDPCPSLGECNNATCDEGADNCAASAGTGCSSDGNPCTDDICDGSGGCVHVNNAAPCNDGLACNGADTCGGGTCSVHAGDPCAGGPECNNTCNPDGSCHVAAGTACTDDGNVCTNDQCDGSGSCSHPANTAPCSDGLFCTGTDTCADGACSAHTGDPCSGGAECNDVCSEAADNCAVSAGTACTDDLNFCTNDECNGSGACAHPNNAEPCNDGVFCNGGADTCSGGSCSVHSGDPCSTGGECNNQCNELANTCFSSPETSCTDDGNVCTNDLCDGGGACLHPNNTASCDDSLFCNGTDTCGDGACVHAGNPCSGGSECSDACNESADNCFDPADTSCTSDGNVCTDDACDGSGTCAHPNNTAPCDDGLFCNVGEVCAGGSCGGGALRDCTDPSTDICTIDSCDEAINSCVNTPNPAQNGTPCNDHDACTTATTCNDGLCIDGTPVNCDDSSECTVDSCDTETGCSNLTTVEDRTCNSCLDGIDNDADEDTDANDDGCATLSEEQHFSIIGRATRGISVYLGSQVLSYAAAGSEPLSTAPFPVGRSRAGVCGEAKMQILSGAQIAGSVAAAADNSIQFGSGINMNFAEYYADAPTTSRVLTGVMPVVGPGNCSVGLAACNLDVDCAPPISTCEGPLLEAANPRVDSTGTHEEFVRCRESKAAVIADELYIFTLPSQVLPAIRHKEDAPQPLPVLTGPGPHILRVPKVRVAAHATLTVTADADSIVVIQVERSISVGKFGTVQVAGGLKPENLLWVADGKGSAIVNGSGSFDGTILAPLRKIKLGQNVVIRGSLYGDKVKITGGVLVTHLPFTAFL